MIDLTTFEHGGNLFRLEVHPDTLATPHDADPGTYSPTDLAAWEHDWRFVMVVLAPVVDGLPDFDAAVEVTGVRYGDAVECTVTTADLCQRAVAEGWCRMALALTTHTARRSAA